MLVLDISYKHLKFWREKDFSGFSLGFDLVHKFWGIDLRLQTKQYDLHRNFLNSYLFFLSFRFIHDLLPLNNFSFGNFVHRMYPQRT